MQNSITAGGKKGPIVIVWMFVAMVVALFLFAYFSLALLSSVRAYVEGEGHYSKGQKDAIYALSRYAQYGQQEDYLIFRTNLAICQGDRQAREALDRPEPDLEAAYQGFLQGRNHPDDIDGLIRLFLRFRNVAEIDKAIAIWTAADAHVEDLSQIGERVQQANLAGELSPAGKKKFLDELHQLNAQLTPLEDDFSFTLGDAARKGKRLTVIAMFVGVSLLLTGACVFSRRVVRHNEMAGQLLLDSRNQLQAALQFAPMPMVILRLADDVILYANDRALEQFKIDRAAVGSLKPSSFYVRSEDREIFLATLRKEGALQELELQLQDTQGNQFWVRYSSQRIRYEGQDCMLTAIVNIDDGKRVHDELHFRAFHDALTGLPNRAMFTESLERVLGRSARNNGVFSILFIDLDNFKLVNDAIGHEMGDLLLQQVAQRLQSCIRKGDLAARLSGDEFVVLLEDTQDVTEIGATAQKILRTLEPIYQLGEHSAEVTCSIGISSYPKDGAELNGLLSAADAAMYRAKSAGRNNVQFFS